MSSISDRLGDEVCFHCERRFRHDRRDAVEGRERAVQRAHRGKLLRQNHRYSQVSIFSCSVATYWLINS